MVLRDGAVVGHVPRGHVTEAALLAALASVPEGDGDTEENDNG